MRLAEMLTNFLNRPPEPSKRYDRAIDNLERTVELFKREVRDAPLAEHADHEDHETFNGQHQRDPPGSDPDKKRRSSN